MEEKYLYVYAKNGKLVKFKIKRENKLYYYVSGDIIVRKDTMKSTTQVFNDLQFLHETPGLKNKLEIQKKIFNIKYILNIIISDASDKFILDNESLFNDIINKYKE